MRLTIDCNTENPKDMLLLKVLTSTVTAFTELECAPNEDEEQESNQAPEEPVAEEKPKRKRRTKAEIEAEKEEQKPVEEELPTPEVPSIPEVTDEEPTEEVKPFEEPIPYKEEDEPQAETPILKTTAAEFRAILEKKRKELGVNLPDGEFHEKCGAFNDFIHKLSEPYGSTKPTQLTDEKRYDFCKELELVGWNEEHTGFVVTKAPF